MGGFFEVLCQWFTNIHTTKSHLAQFQMSSNTKSSIPLSIILTMDNKTRGAPQHPAHQRRARGPKSGVDPRGIGCPIDCPLFYCMWSGRHTKKYIYSSTITLDPKPTHTSLMNVSICIFFFAARNSCFHLILHPTLPMIYNYHSLILRLITTKYTTASESKEINVDNNAFVPGFLLKFCGGDLLLVWDRITRSRQGGFI